MPPLRLDAPPEWADPAVAVRVSSVRGIKFRAVAVTAAMVVATSMAACSGNEGSPTPPPAPSTGATSASATPSPTPTPTPSPSPTKADYDPITGEKKVDDVVVAVKIDNVAAARPQVGLDQADMIVVERVEADLTRLMAIYHSNWPKRVGPVRSARNTDVEFLPMFGKPALVFSGANGKVAKQVRSSPYIVPVKRVRRDYSRVAPHNVIINLNNVKTLPDIGKAEPIGYVFGKSDQWDKATKDASFTVPIGTDDFGFRHVDGHYTVSWNGDPYADGDSGDPVLADNVVRLKVKSHKDANTTSDLSEVIETVGSGEATVYSHGKRLTGSWERKELDGPMSLKTEDGKDLVLQPGKTWLLLDG
jgi:hypothetical protein